MTETKKPRTKKQPPADWQPDAACLKMGIEQVAKAAGEAIRKSRDEIASALRTHVKDEEQAFKLLLARVDTLEQVLVMAYACLMVKMGHPPTHEAMLSFAGQVNIDWPEKFSRALGLPMQ